MTATDRFFRDLLEKHRTRPLKHPPNLVKLCPFRVRWTRSGSVRWTIILEQTYGSSQTQAF
jgi:hypothetical protein